MNRCNTLLMVAIVLTGASTSLLPVTAAAQTEDAAPALRQFPKTAARGVLTVMTPPEVAMDGKPDRLSPAVRIRDTRNVLVLSGAISGQPLVVNYVRDNIGLVQQVWILSAEEARQKMPGNDAGLLGNMRSMFESRPAVDNGSTPYDQLPRYK